MRKMHLVEQVSVAGLAHLFFYTFVVVVVVYVFASLHGHSLVYRYAAVIP